MKYIIVASGPVTRVALKIDCYVAGIIAHKINRCCVCNIAVRKGIIALSQPSHAVIPPLPSHPSPNPLNVLSST